MSDLSGLINLIPIDDIAKKLGVDPSVAEVAIAVAVPTMVGGLAANAQDAGGAKSLESALGKHTTTSMSIDKIDTADGQKIVKHVFGSKQSDVVAAAAGKAGAPGAPSAPASSTGGGIGEILGGLISDPHTQSAIGGLLGSLLGGGTK